MNYEFFVPCHVDGLNKRQRTHWTKRHKQDKRAQVFWGALINSRCPRIARVWRPHPRRIVGLMVFRKRLLDYDGLVGGLKPFIDVLRCRWNRKPRVLTWEGIIYDDSPKYVKWDIDQKVVGESEMEGVLVTVKVTKEGK